MKRKNILDALNGIDFDMVEDSEGKHHRAHGALWLRWTAVAACLCLVIAAIIALPIALRYGKDRWLEIPDDTTGEQTDISPDGADGTDLTVDTDDTALSPGANGTESADSEGTDSPSGEYVSSYELKNVDGQLYMVFDSYNVPPNDADDLPDGSYGVTFDSIEDFQRGVINNEWNYGIYEGKGFRELTVDEMYKIVSTFTRDEIGVPIVNMYNLYLPDMPDGWELGWGEEYPVVDWRDGDDYIIYVSNPTENKRATFRMLSQSRYESALDGLAQSYGEPSSIDADGKDIYVFDHASSSGKHTVTIYTADSVFSTSYYYSYSLIDETGAPSEEYCLSFGAKKQYVSDYNIEKVGDQWYMILDSRGIRPKNYDAMRIGGIGFSSMAEFKYSILDKKLSVYDLETFAWWDHDEIGIPILDFDDLYFVEKTPKPGYEEEIRWMSGEVYTQAHVGEDGLYDVLACFVFDNNFEGQEPDKTVHGDGKTLEYFDLSNSYTYYARITEGDSVYTLRLDKYYNLTDEDVLSMNVKKFEE